MASSTEEDSVASRVQAIATMLVRSCYFLPESGAKRRCEGAAEAIQDDQLLGSLPLREIRAALKWWISQLTEDRMPQNPPHPRALRRCHEMLVERDKPKAVDDFGPTVGTGAHGMPIRLKKGQDPMFVALHSAFGDFCMTAPDMRLASWKPEHHGFFHARRDEWQEVLPSSSAEVELLRSDGVDLEEWVRRMQQGLPYVDEDEDIG